MSNKRKYNLTTLYFPGRIMDRLSLINSYPMTIVEAPSGFGKTTAIRAFLNKYDKESIPVYWHTFFGEGFSASWKSIYKIFARIDKEGTEKLLELGTPNEDSIPLITEVLENLECTEETYIVLDNFQDINISFAKQLLESLSKHGGENLHIIIITQQLSLGGTLIAVQNHHIYRIYPQDLTFTKSDAEGYYKQAGLSITSKELDSVYLRSDGWIAALYLQMLNFVQTGNFESGDMQKLIQAAMWSKLSPNEQDALLTLSIFQSFTMAQLQFMMRKPDEATEITLRENPFIRFDRENRHYYIHSILMSYLLPIFNDKADEDKKEVYMRAGDWFSKNNSYMNALHFYHLADVAGAYEKIFALPLTSLEIADNSIGENIRPIIFDMIDKTSKDTKLRYPGSMINVAFALFFMGEHVHLMRMREEIGDIIDLSYVSDKQKNVLRGEMELLMSFLQYNKIDKMSEKHRKALDLIGGPTRIISNKSTWTFGSPSVLYMYYRESGKLSEELEQMDKCMPYYYQLAEGHGSGAEIVMRAETEFNRGNLDESETLCQKSLFVADSKKQNSIYLCGLLLLARIAIMRGDSSALLTIIQSLQERDKQNHEDLCRYTLDLCKGFLHVTLSEMQNLPTWLSQGEKIESHLSMMTVPFAHIIHGRALLYRKEYLKLLGIGAYIIGVSNVFPNLLPQIYTKIYLAQAYEALGKETEAVTYLIEALETALPDNIYMPFVENIEGIKKLLPLVAHRINDKDGLAKIDELARTFREAVLKIKANKPSLSDREQEVYMLIAEGFTNKQIAEQLFVSPATVKTHVSHILEKMGVTSRTQLWEQKK